MEWTWSRIRSIPARVFVCSVLNFNHLLTSWWGGLSCRTLQYAPELKQVAVPYYLNEVKLKLLSIESNTPCCHCDTDSAKYRREVRVRSTVFNVDIESVVWRCRDSHSDRIESSQLAKLVGTRSRTMNRLLSFTLKRGAQLSTLMDDVHLTTARHFRYELRLQPWRKDQLINRSWIREQCLDYIPIDHMTCIDIDYTGLRLCGVSRFLIC